MAVELEDFLTQINADDDEVDICKSCLNHAKSFVEIELNKSDGIFEINEKDLYNDIKDRIILEVATNFYLHRDGATKTVFNNSSSLDTLTGFIRTPSI